MPTPAAPVIRLDQVSVARGGRPILSDVTLAFAPRGTYSILGPSGAGKTTLLRLLNRLQEPTTGGLWFHDTPYTQLPAIVLRRRVAMVFQVPVVFTGTVRQNLLLPVRLQHRPAAAAHDGDLAPRLEVAGLDGAWLDRDAATLSVGEKQRLCVARALMTEPEVVLLDEPTAALDPTAAHRLLESISALNRRMGLTVIMVSHQPDQARSVGGEVILLAGGSVAEQTAAAQFFERPASDIGRRYLDRSLTGVAE